VRAASDMQLAMVPKSEATVLELDWSIPEKGARTIPFEKWLFVNLDAQRGKLRVHFELTARLLDNRRTELPVWVRTNKIELP
jgi:hypothetical protein